MQEPYSELRDPPKPSKPLQRYGVIDWGPAEAWARRHPFDIVNRLLEEQARAERAFRSRHAVSAQKLNLAARVLDSISYKAVLERGFALVRGDDGSLRRRAGALAAGEGLTLVFADGEAAAVAAGHKPEKPGKAKKPGTDQGSLF